MLRRLGLEDMDRGVFVLEVDLDTYLRWIDERVALDPTDFGGRPDERELAVRVYHTREDVPKTGFPSTQIRPLAALWSDYGRKPVAQIRRDFGHLAYRLGDIYDGWRRDD
jgi:hypothetical protein